jgi:hypothetical protein
VDQTLKNKFAGVADDPVVRVAAYYVVLAAATAVVWQVFPSLHTIFSAERLDALSQQPVNSGNFLDAFDAGFVGLPAPAVLALTTALCMSGAFLLMLPVCWVYILTRQKKGYTQSVVQTLIILPIVVAGVVLLVKNSVALAFSLGGIVAAVSFRNTLRDTKDAVYIFLATGVGLAAGVQVMSAAAVMSFLFNVVILAFWYTDFGRAPSHLEGPRAARRLERSLALANRTNAFVAQIDREILRSMSPEQLEALASRAKRRVDGAALGGKPKKPLNTVIRIRSPEPEAARRAVEEVLAAQVKEWRLAGLTREAGGGGALEYRARLRKSVPADSVAGELRARLGPQLTGVEMS